MALSYECGPGGYELRIFYGGHPAKEDFHEVRRWFCKDWKSFCYVPCEHVLAAVSTCYA